MAVPFLGVTVGTKLVLSPFSPKQYLKNYTMKSIIIYYNNSIGILLMTNLAYDHVKCM